METVIKQRETKSGGTLRIVRVNALYIVQYLNRIGKVTCWRYVGRSLEKAEKSYNK